MYVRTLCCAEVHDAACQVLVSLPLRYELFFPHRRRRIVADGAMAARPGGRSHLGPE